MSKEVLLCKDCKFSKMTPFNRIVTLNGVVGAKGFMYKCTKTLKPGHNIIDPVTGPEYIKPAISYCEVERKHGDCGPTAKNWVPKKKKDLFKMLTKEEHD